MIPRKLIVAKVDTAVQITKAIVALHNFLMSNRKETDIYSYCPVNYVDQDGPHGTNPGEWMSQKAPVSCHLERLVQITAQKLQRLHVIYLGNILTLHKDLFHGKLKWFVESQTHMIADDIFSISL